MRLLKIPATAREYYRAYLEFLSPLIPLGKQERDVLGELLYLQYLCRDVPQQYRKGLLAPEFRQGICQHLGLSVQSFYNSVSRLRKAGVLLGNQLNPSYVFDYDRDRQVILEFVDHVTAGDGSGDSG